MKNINTVIDKVDKMTLKRSFMDACSDKDFRDYVYSLSIGEDILIKYTSSLEDCFVEHKKCVNCKSLTTCTNKVAGYELTPELKGRMITFSYNSCSRRNKYLDENAYTKNIELFRMSDGVINASIKDIYKDDKARLPILKYFKEFMDKYKDDLKPSGIYLTGSFGSGKTYLIAALFNEMAKKNVRSALVYYPELLRMLKASFSTDYGEKFDYIKKVPLLLLDDIGAENTTAWSRDEVLGPILQYRMEEKLPTFFTSNLTIEDLESSLAVTSGGADKVKARRIVERIKQLTISLELISENRRKY